MLSVQVDKDDFGLVHRAVLLFHGTPLVYCDETVGRDETVAGLLSELSEFTREALEKINQELNGSPHLKGELKGG